MKSIIETPYHIDTEGLTKARGYYNCTRCGGEVQPGEHYYQYNQRGPKLHCIKCIAYSQAEQHNHTATDIYHWLERLG